LLLLEMHRMIMWVCITESDFNSALFELKLSTF
jgi:hypothetical protein